MKRLVALCLATLILTGCASLPPETEATGFEIAPPVVTQREVVTIGRGAVESRLALNVSFGAEQQLPLYFRSGGRLRSMSAFPGQRVEAGAILAELEAGSLPYDLAGAELDLERARLKLEHAQGRIGFVDGPDQVQLSQYELDLRGAELRVERLRSQLADTRITAPVAGQVVQVDSSEGSMVEPYSPVLVLAADGPVVARAPVDESQAARLTAGQRVELFPSDGDPTPIAGTVLSVPILGTREQSRVAIFSPDAPSPRLRVGRNGKAEVVLQRKEDVLLVPLSALRTFNNRTFVTLVEGESRREVAVEIGLQGEQYAEVLSGLKEGDRVIGR